MTLAPSIPLWRELLPNSERIEIIGRRDAAGDPELVDLAAGSVVSIGQNELVTDADLIKRSGPPLRLRMTGQATATASTLGSFGSVANDGIAFAGAFVPNQSSLSGIAPLFGALDAANRLAMRLNDGRLQLAIGDGGDSAGIIADAGVDAELVIFAMNRHPAGGAIILDGRPVASTTTGTYPTGMSNFTNPATIGEHDGQTFAGDLALLLGAAGAEAAALTVTQLEQIANSIALEGRCRIPGFGRRCAGVR